MEPLAPVIALPYPVDVFGFRFQPGKGGAVEMSRIIVGDQQFRRCRNGIGLFPEIGRSIGRRDLGKGFLDGNVGAPGNGLRSGGVVAPGERNAVGRAGGRIGIGRLTGQKEGRQTQQDKQSVLHDLISISSTTVGVR